MNLSGFFIKKIDGWIPASIAIDEEQKLRARVIVSVMALCSSSVGLTGLILWVGALSGSDALWDGVIASIAVSFTWYGGILFFRHTKNLLWTSHLFAFIMYSSTLGALLTSGGWSSPINSLLLAIPVGIFLVAGRQVGFLWAFISAVSYYVLWKLHRNDISLMQIVRPEHQDYLSVGIWCFSLFVMISCMTVYDRMAEILKHSLRTEREQYRERMMKDNLSGVFNRFGAQKKFEEFIRAGKNVLFLYFNISNLSMINSELDYKAGDDLIKTVSKTSLNIFPSSAVLGRMTGGEFLLLLPDVKDRQEAQGMAQKLFSAFSHPFKVMEGKYEISVRGGIGAVLSQEHSREFRQLIKTSYEAMQESDDQQVAVVIR